LQGEDSVVSQGWDESGREKAWTFQSALKQISQTLEKDEDIQCKRTSVASIIAATRRNIQNTIMEKKKDTTSNIHITQSEDESNDDDDDDDASLMQEVETYTLQSMAQDQVRDRHGSANDYSTLTTNHALEEQEKNDNNKDEDDHDDDLVLEISRKETIQKEKERREEGEKAAKFFDSTEIAHATYEEDNNQVVIFSQLNLSRPLLRGVAAMGFVKPTPIQIKVIPAVLAGRDVCAR